MYTRSYPRRSLPPDYGGTALTIRPPEAEDAEPAAREAVLAPSQDSGNRRPRRPPFGRERPPERPSPPPPFGGAGVTSEVPPPPQPPLSPSPPMPRELPAGAEGQHPFLGSFLDPGNLKSDDLLLLGLALLLISDKDRPEGESCADALLILAMLYVSGL